MPARRTPEELEELVMAAVLRALRPATAYELVSELADVRLAPQQAYRTLARLLATGRIARIETLRAYRPSACSNGREGPIVFCRRCRASVRASATDLEDDLRALAERSGFRPARAIVEVSGLCPGCAAASGGGR